MDRDARTIPADHGRRMSRDDEVLVVLHDHAAAVARHRAEHEAAGLPISPRELWCCERLDRQGEHLCLEQIAGRAGMPRRSARRALERLIAAGRVAVTPIAYAEDVERFRACDTVGGTSEAPDDLKHGSAAVPR